MIPSFKTAAYKQLIEITPLSSGDTVIDQITKTLKMAMVKCLLRTLCCTHLAVADSICKVSL
jgi:hypothetical protein